MTQQNSFLGTEEPALVTPSSDEKTMAVLAHVLTLVAGFIAPLVIYLIKKDSTPAASFAVAHAKESLNFQLTLLIAFIISAILWIILIGILITWLLGILALVLVIIATIKASEGKFYKYPFSIKFVK
ncbi:MAG: DUF4870 domain-containing protein [Chitinophagaceae bacterium]|nr:DUF4870 domain-containing protein [Chitinophagaceae bacterium]